ncbi:MAG: 2-oxoacid:acceptor oxidoreductase subunit alpha [Bryobacterales bacterium]|nr:2-oxoacid:acceptor oxidoreductase subunit alpha [Bryobacterales bacterium]
MQAVSPSPAGETAYQARSEVVNDFSIQVATVNGSGSQSSNLVLLRALFHMGVPVSGKNLFPSNIAGLPTWYTIRANKAGFTGRKKEIDLLVAMNPETALRDVQGLEPGRTVVYDEPLALDSVRDDLCYYPVPFDRLTVPVCPVPRLRKLVRNMVYDGVLAWLLGIDMEEIRGAINKQFSTKPKAAAINWDAAVAGFEWSARNLVKRDPYRLERMDANRGKIIVEGNAAAALGAVFGGVSVITWYPITPSSSLAEAAQGYLKRFRTDQNTGKATFAIVQAEDELASIGMAVGAGWAGARAMTTTAGPGISLMSEFVGLAHFAEIPMVLIDVQRMGPSTGLPTRTSQGDLISAADLSHGDTIHPLLIPSTPEECFDFSARAFDVAERLQTPVFVMLDLDLGMNYWVADKFEYPDWPMDRGKLLSEADIERLRGDWGRYRDIDGDGITYRTVPGNRHPQAAYFARGTGHDEDANYSEREDDWIRNLSRIKRKLVGARDWLPEPVIDDRPGASVGVLAAGTSHEPVRESRTQLRDEYGFETAYCRVRGWPFSEAVERFIASHDRVYVVDQNRDGQLRRLLRRQFPEDYSHLRSVCYFGGLPLDARTITDAIVEKEQL